MSSVSGSDRARQSEELRRMREEYENQESEQAKKQKKEVRRLQTKNAETINNVKETYEGRLDAIREKNRASLSAKDETHAAQTEKIRDMYHEQLRRKTEEADQSMAILKDTNRSETQKQKLIAEQQKNGLENNYKEVIKQKDQQYEDYSEEARSTIQQSIADRTKKLNDRHAKDIEVVTTDRDRRIVEMQNDGGKQKNYLESEIKDLNRRHRSEKTRLEENYRNMNVEQSKMMDEALIGRSEILQNERGSMRDEFRGRVEDETAKFDLLRENLKNQVQERSDREVRSAETELRQVKAASLVRDQSSGRLRNLEQSHLIEQYEKRIKDLEMQRDNTRGLVSEETQKKISQMGEKSGDILQTVNRNNRLNQNLIVQRSREDRANLESELKFKVDATKESAEDRIGKIQTQAREGSLTESKYYHENMNQAKGAYQEQLNEQRQAQMETLIGIRVDMKDKMKAQELKAQGKLEQTIANYEEKVKNLVDSHKQEIANLKKSYESRMGQRDQGHKIDTQQVAQKYELRMSANEERHQQEIEKIQRRNEQNMAELANKMSFATKKKA